MLLVVLDLIRKLPSTFLENYCCSQQRALDIDVEIFTITFTCYVLTMRIFMEYLDAITLTKNIIPEQFLEANPTKLRLRFAKKKRKKNCVPTLTAHEAKQNPTPEPMNWGGESRFATA